MQCKHPDQLRNLGLFCCYLGGLFFTIPCWAADTSGVIQPSTDPVVNYVDALERAEEFDGAYSAELIDLYLGLGRTLLERSDYEEAKKAFQRGMQVERVNFGLNSLRQTPFMFAIADIESHEGNWDSAEEILQNLYMINANEHGENTIGMLPVLNQLSEWYMARYRMRSPEGRYETLTRFETLTSHTALILEQKYGLGHPETAEVLNRIGYLNYIMATHVAQYGDLVEPELTFTSRTSPRPFTAQTSLVDKHYRRGKEAFSKVINSLNQQEDASATEIAAAIARLGDWHLAFGRSQAASKLYFEAWTSMAESGVSEDKAAEYFSQPSPLRFLDEDPPPAEGQTLEVSMTITRTGLIHDFEVLNSPDNVDENQLRNVKRNMRGKRFRPRVVDGEPVETNGFIWQLPIDPSEET